MQPSPGMQVGVYIGGFNLYYGGKFLCGPSTAGWRWLDVRALAARLVTNHSAWTGTIIDRIVYCTARISGADNPIGSREQDAYLAALTNTRTADHIEYGNYVNRATSEPPNATVCALHPKTRRHSDVLMAMSGEGGRVVDYRLHDRAVEGTLSVSPSTRIIH
jgi:hypothetical protein